MALHKFVISRGNYPFLTLRKLTEESPEKPDIELTGDEVESYDQAVRSFAEWQERLANVDGPT